jgi:hypothetical protein
MRDLKIASSSHYVYVGVGSSLWKVEDAVGQKFKLLGAFELPDPYAGLLKEIIWLSLSEYHLPNGFEWEEDISYRSNLLVKTPRLMKKIKSTMRLLTKATPVVA